MEEGKGDGNLLPSTKSILMETEHELSVLQKTPMNTEPIDLASTVTDILELTSNSVSNECLNQYASEPNVVESESLMETESVPDLIGQQTPKPIDLASNVTDISESSSNSVSLCHDPSQPDLGGSNCDDQSGPASDLVELEKPPPPELASLSVIANYGSDSYDSDDDDTSNCNNASVTDSALPAPAPVATVTEYRTIQSASEDSDSDSSKSSDDESSSSSSSEACIEEACLASKTHSKSTAKDTPKEKRCPREKALEDLPPIEDLQITVPENSCQEMGFIASIVEQQVVVQAKANFPPLNLDTVLFLDRGQRPLGSIFDVLGQVSEPLYTVRFNSAEHIKRNNIEAGMAVFCAPHSEHTNFVFMDELLKLKGSDQGWDPSAEPTPDCLDFSDDEAERNYRRSQETARGGGAMDWDAPPRKRVNSFERRMNERNLRKSALPPEPQSLFTGFVQRVQRAQRGRNPAGCFAGLPRASRPSSGPVFPSPATSAAPVFQPRSGQQAWDSGNERRGSPRMRGYCFPPPTPSYSSFCVGLSQERTRFRNPLPARANIQDQMRYHNAPAQAGANPPEHVRYHNAPTQAGANPPEHARYHNAPVQAGATNYRNAPSQAAANAQVAALALAYSMGAPSSPMFPAGYHPRQAYPMMLRPPTFSTSTAHYDGNTFTPFSSPPPTFPPCYPPQGAMLGQPYSPMFSGMPIFNPGFPPPQIHHRANIYPVAPPPPPRGGV